MAKKRTYTWYAEALDARTNEIIANGLGQDAEESFTGDILIPPDKKRHQLWRCPFSVVNFLQKSRNYLDLKFRVYNREGQGKIRKCDVIQG